MARTSKLGNYKNNKICPLTLIDFSLKEHKKEKSIEHVVPLGFFNNVPRTDTDVWRINTSKTANNKTSSIEQNIAQAILMSSSETYDFTDPNYSGLRNRIMNLPNENGKIKKALNTSPKYDKNNKPFWVLSHISKNDIKLVFDKIIRCAEFYTTGNIIPLKYITQVMFILPLLPNEVADILNTQNIKIFSIKNFECEIATNTIVGTNISCWLFTFHKGAQTFIFLNGPPAEIRKYNSRLNKMYKKIDKKEKYMKNFNNTT